MALTETTTVTREVTGPRADLVHFVKFLERIGAVTLSPGVDDQQLLKDASDFWETQHGED